VSNRIGALAIALVVFLFVGCPNPIPNPINNNNPPEATKYQVTYDGNGFTGGTVPSASAKVEKSTSVTIENAGTMARGSYFFAGWNTAADGSATWYVPGASLSMPENDVVLYAQWPFAMAVVPAKSFKTGADDIGTDSSVTAAFQLAQSEVTYALWYQVKTWAAANGYTFANPGMEGNDGSVGAAPTTAKKEPVTQVNWRDAMIWCNALTEWLNARSASSYTCAYYTDAAYAVPLRTATNSATVTNTTDGSQDAPYVLSGATGFRLPGSMEWELAARYRSDGNNDGDILDANEYYLGSYASGATADHNDLTATEAVAWVNTNSSGSTQPVATRTANQLTLFDMSGNVEELCFDWQTAGTSRVMRGGSWSEGSGALQVGSLAGQAPNAAANNVGLRFARSAPGATIPYYVSYDGNGSNGGTVPEDLAPYTTGSSFTVLTQGTLTKTGYSFAGWNTQAGGGGQSYTVSVSYAMLPANLILYAQWSINNYAITYSGNGNSGGSVPAVVYHAYNSTVTVQPVGDLLKTDCTFAGWNTYYDGSGTSYPPGSTFSMPAGNFTVYAQWAPFTMKTVTHKSFKTGTDDLGTASVTTDFLLGQAEVTYELWYTVRTWAVVNGYTFANPGKEGNDGTAGDPPTTAKLEPVTTINWRDALVWCNALTEWLNAHASTTYTRAYYSNSGFTTPLKDSSDGAYGSSVNSTLGSVDNPYVLSSATGFRLPGSMEWELAARYKADSNSDGDISDAGEYYWGTWPSGGTIAYNDTGDVSPANGVPDGKDSNDRVSVYGAYWNGTAWSVTGVIKTANAKSKIADALGLYDMSGNVEQWCFDWHPSYVNARRVTRGGAWYDYADRLQVGTVVDVIPYNEYDYVGFRIARLGP
jgi:uncharacterized repeat protein (TIGR02543 family)